MSNLGTWIQNVGAAWLMTSLSPGFVAPEQGSRHYTAFVMSESERWTKVIKAAGIKPQ